MLVDLAAGRTRSPHHEARFLNLLGFCLRPGFGAARDASRLSQARRIYMAGLTFRSEVQGQSEDNLAALSISITPDDEAFVDSLVPPGEHSGKGFQDPNYPVLGRPRAQS